MTKGKTADFMTRANVPAPRRTTLPTPPKGQAADNMKEERLAPMTFNMPADWHREFKTTAAMHGISMKDLLVESFAAWKKERG